MGEGCLHSMRPVTVADRREKLGQREVVPLVPLLVFLRRDLPTLRVPIPRAVRRYCVH